MEKPFLAETRVSDNRLLKNPPFEKVGGRVDDRTMCPTFSDVRRGCVDFHIAFGECATLCISSATSMSPKIIHISVKSRSSTT
jgi:hypothetical protein